MPGIVQRGRYRRAGRICDIDDLELSAPRLRGAAGRGRADKVCQGTGDRRAGVDVARAAVGRAQGVGQRTGELGTGRVAEVDGQEVAKLRGDRAGASAGIIEAAGRHVGRGPLDEQAVRDLVVDRGIAQQGRARRIGQRIDQEVERAIGVARDHHQVVSGQRARFVPPKFTRSLLSVSSLLSVPEPNVPTTVGLAGLLTSRMVMSAAPIE